ncbi:hypothetical protein GBA63_19125 [Rubrobacter tropicus]|uniref:Uncharacterized protein n=1 Tax=Rubrobacter tropicus TaxID=2653851 RepID=A0A6G8QDG3_9ACTN|nr:hypothetical protein [Rubrobacter tropicus]QIN84519.1 hypothetical protein GBA63_19125 [Rubrobacter tropicus]
MKTLEGGKSRASCYFSRRIIVYSGVVLRTVHRRAGVGARAGVALLPTLLITALLLCPGALGFAHGLSPCGPCEPTDAPDFLLKHHAPADEAALGGGDSGYYAAVIELAGATLLVLLLGVPPRREAPYRGPPLQRTHPRAVAHYARGPSPPLLQAFRL